jgi:hypothetical protein
VVLRTLYSALRTQYSVLSTPYVAPAEQETINPSFPFPPAPFMGRKRGGKDVTFQAFRPMNAAGQKREIRRRFLSCFPLKPSAYVAGIGPRPCQPAAKISPGFLTLSASSISTNQSGHSPGVTRKGVYSTS